MAFGLRTVKEPTREAKMQFAIDSGDGTRVGIGDPVKFAGSSKATFGALGRPTVIRAAAGDRIVGVVLGVVPDEESSLMYRAASTNRDVICVVDQDAEFYATEDGVGGFLDADSVGGNIDLVAADCSTSTAISGYALDSSSFSASSTGQCKILGLADIPGNVAGTTSTVWRVKIIEHQLGADAVGA